MADHSENKPLENKMQGQEKVAPSSLVFQDEDEDTPDFDRTINLGTPVISSPDNHSFDSTIQFDSMESLFEEEPAKQISETGKADTRTVSELEKPDDDAYDLGIDTDELEGLKDFMMEDDNSKDEPTVVLADMPDDDDDAPSNSHKAANEPPGNPGDNLDDKNNLLTAPAKKIELTEADYADTDEMSADIPEDISEPEKAIDSQAITATANEAHALQDKPGMSAKDGTPEALLAKESAAPPAAQPRTGLATALGLIGIIGASGALWMAADLSGRMDQLESQLAAMQSNRVTLDQRRNIASLNQRVDELGTQFAAHLKTIAQAKDTSPAPDVEKPPAPASLATKPTVTAIKPAVNSGHGPWVINLTSLSHAIAANNEVTRLKRLGIHAESIKVMTQGKIWYRIRVPGFSSAEDADRQRRILGNRLGIRDTWIGKR